jgi:hypothetical protein
MIKIKSWLSLKITNIMRNDLFRLLMIYCFLNFYFHEKKLKERRKYSLKLNYLIRKLMFPVFSLSPAKVDVPLFDNIFFGTSICVFVVYAFMCIIKGIV